MPQYESTLRVNCAERVAQHGHRIVRRTVVAEAGLFGKRVGKLGDESRVAPSVRARPRNAR